MTWPTDFRNRDALTGRHCAESPGRNDDGRRKDMKRFLIMLLTVILATNACAMAGSFNAARPEVFTSGDYDYTVYEGKAVITQYNGNDQVIDIPSEIDGYPVASIGLEAFRYQQLKSVTFPDGFPTIGKKAFEYCIITDGLKLPENVTIAEDAFSYAKLPPTVVIPSGATVEECAFSYCEDMERLVVEPGSTIKGRAFGYCYQLQHVVCGGGTYLEKYAFEYCRKLKQAILCRDVAVEEGAFYDCGDGEIKWVETDEYDALKQSALDGTLGAELDPPSEPEERILEIIDSPAAQDGVTVALAKATAVKEQKPERFRYTLAGTLENDSDEGIMQIVYTFSLIDENGEEFRSFAEVYDGEDTALPPHGKIDFCYDDITWGKQSVPAAVRIGISSVKTETELPPAHVPKTGDYLYKTLDDEKLANIREEMPVELTFHVDEGGYGQTAVFKAGDGLDEAVRRFCAIQIGEETGEWVTDNYNWIGFTWKDGSHSGISLNLYNLEYAIHSSFHMYKLENLDAFWSYCAEYLKDDE